MGYAQLVIGPAGSGKVSQSINNSLQGYEMRSMFVGFLGSVVTGKCKTYITVFGPFGQ